MSDEVRGLLGDESVQAFVRLARTKTLPCRLCHELIPFDSPEPVSLVAMTFRAEPEQPRRVEVLVTHRHCAPSTVAALDIDFPGLDVAVGPDSPMFSLLRPQGTRGAVLFECAALSLGVPLDGREPHDDWIETCLAMGLHLVMEPFLEFERSVAGWHMQIADPVQGLEIHGPGSARVLCPDPIPEHFLGVLTEQRRCLLITGSALLGDDLYRSGVFDADDVVAQLELARCDGRLVGGVVEVELAAANVIGESPEEQGRRIRRSWRLPQRSMSQRARPKAT